MSLVKGSSFERELALKLSLWVSGGEDKCVFKRRAGSGGSFRDFKGLSGHIGDIDCDKYNVGGWLTDAVVFECKFYKNMGRLFWNWVGTGKGLIAEWLKDLEVSLGKVNKDIGFLVIKGNGLKPLVIGSSVDGSYPLILYTVAAVGGKKICYGDFFQDGRVNYFFSLDSWLELSDKDKVKDILINK